MKLIEDFQRFGDIDKHRRNWLTFAKTKQNRIVPLGDPPKLTIGERILGRYSQFFQLYTGWTRETSQVDAVSAIGEMKLHATIETSYRIDKLKAEDAILDGIDLEESILRPLAQTVRKLAKDYRPDDYKAFENAVEAQLKFDCAAIARKSVFEINDIEVSVRRDENVADVDEIKLLVNTVQARLVKAVHDENAGKAESLRMTLNVMHELQNRKINETVDAAAQAQVLQKAINDLLDADMPSDDLVMVSLRAQQATFVRQAETSYSGDGGLQVSDPPQGKLGNAREAPEDMD